MLTTRCILRLYVRYCHTRPFKPICSELDRNDAKRGLDRFQEGTKNLEKLQMTCLQGGGEKAILRHTKSHKKLLARDRLSKLLDPGTDFLEIGLMAGLDMPYGCVPSAGAVGGIGTIAGTLCVVWLNDATVKGGTFYPITVTKSLRMQAIAKENGLPAVNFIDSGGAFLPLQADIFPDKKHGGRTFYNQAVMSAQGILQVTVVCGSCTAGAAYTPTMSEEALIVSRIGTVFLAGPPLVKAATGECVSPEDLGGADLHCRLSGCTDFFAETEEEALSECRDVVASFNMPPVLTPTEPSEAPLFQEEELNGLSGLESWTKQHMYEVIARILDGSRFREFKKLFGTNLVVGFGYIEGQLVGIVMDCGPLTSKDALKGCHFVQVCDQRDIPLLFFQCCHLKEDNYCSEGGPLLKDRGKMAASVATAQVPKIAVNMLGCHGDANLTMCGPGFGPNLHLSWPLCSSTPLDMHSPEPVTTAADSKDSPAPLPLSDFDPSSSLYSASHLLTDAIILPSHTRKVLASCLHAVLQQNRMAMPRRLSVLRM